MKRYGLVQSKCFVDVCVFVKSLFLLTMIRSHLWQLMNHRNFLLSCLNITEIPNSLQRRRTLAKCRDDIELLVESVKQYTAMAVTDYSQCKLQFNQNNSTLLFDKVVVKLQQGNTNSLTRAEKSSMSILRNERGWEPDKELQGNAKLAKTLVARLAERRKKNGNGEYCIDCYFVLASVSSVELHIRIAKHVFPNNRRLMMPQSFAVICFLKKQVEIWNSTLFVRAVHRARKEHAEERVRPHEAQDSESWGTAL